LSWFKDAFARYLANSENSTATTQQTSCDETSSDFSNRNSVAVEKPPKPAPDNSCCSVAVENTENGARATNEGVEGTDFIIQPKDSPSLSDDENWDSLVKSLPADTERF
jgi:hypothetical protein